MYDNFKTANYPRSLVSPEMYGRHLSRLFSGDVIDGLTVAPGTGLKVTLQPGNTFVRYGAAAVASARLVSLVDNFTLDIDVPDASNPRIDSVIVYIDNTVNLPSGSPTSANLDGPGVAKAKIVKGAPAANPQAPNSTALQAGAGAGNPYTVVAQVRVDTGVSVIASNKIADVRVMASGILADGAVPAPKIDFSSFSDKARRGSAVSVNPSSTSMVSTSAGSFTVGQSGILMVSLTTTCSVDFQAGFSWSGANTLALAADQTYVGTAASRGSLVRLWTDLTPGVIDLAFHASRRSGTGGATAYGLIDCFTL